MYEAGVSAMQLLRLGGLCVLENYCYASELPDTLLQHVISQGDD